jgi:ferredoxin-thioredoxin reductase catalytic chain
MASKKRERTKEDAIKFAYMVAKKQGWKINKDAEFLDTIYQGLATNFNRYGYYCCPCRDSDEDKTLDKDIICPCDYCKPDMEEFGHCFCGLYLTSKFFESEKEPEGIPERRPLDI